MTGRRRVMWLDLLPVENYADAVGKDAGLYVLEQSQATTLFVFH